MIIENVCHNYSKTLKYLSFRLLNKVTGIVEGNANFQLEFREDNSVTFFSSSRPYWILPTDPLDMHPRLRALLYRVKASEGRWCSLHLGLGWDEDSASSMHLRGFEDRAGKRAGEEADVGG